MTTPKQKAAASNRMKVWQHNSFLEGAAMARANMDKIIQSDTATDEAKRIARAIFAQTFALENALKERRK